jgi:glycosyltransferase involved in cell wall biosynthesis
MLKKDEMKVLVSIDEHVFYYEGQYYGRELAVDLIERYLQVFDRIRVATRVVEVDQIDNDVYRPMQNDRVDFYPLRFFRGYVQYFLNFRTLRRQYREVLGDCQAAVVRLPSTIGFSIARHVLKQGLPLGCEVVANPLDFFRIKPWGFNKLFYGVYHLQLKHACRNANSVAYVTRNALQQIYPARVNAFTTHYSSAKIRDEFYTQPRAFTLKERFMLCHVAHPINNKEKGHELVIQMLVALNELMPNRIAAQFAGDGELIPELLQLAESLGVRHLVEFPGILSMPALHQFMCESDVMVFPTLTEGLPRVVIEAMSTGLPCVSTPVGGIPELLSEESLFAPDDMMGFVDRIYQLLTDKEFYEAESRRNYECSLEYSDDKLQAKRNDFYRSIQKKTNNLKEK